MLQGAAGRQTDPIRYAKLHLTFCRLVPIDMTVNFR